MNDRKLTTDRRKRRAAILVMTLWIVVVLSLISASLLEEVYLDLKITKFHRDDFIAMTLARAGIARAVADLRNDLMIDREGQTEPMDALGDIWAQKEDKRNKINVELGPREGKYTVWIDDEAAKFNLNAIDLNTLKVVFYELKMEEADAQALATAIVDWVDPNDTVEGMGVLEDDYYSAGVAKAQKKDWEEGDPPLYRCKNDAFTSVDELLSVYGITPDLFYGVDMEKELPPNPIEQLKTRVKEIRRRRRRDEVPGLRDIFTVQPHGGINLNTADRFVLQVLFRSVVGDPATSKAFVDKIMNLRGTGNQGRRSNDNAFHSVDDLVRVAGVPSIYVTQLMRNRMPLSVRSDHFQITSLGEVGDAQHLITTIVARSYETFQPDSLVSLVDRGSVNQRFLDAFERRWGSRRDQINQASVRVMEWHEL